MLTLKACLSLLLLPIPSSVCPSKWHLNPEMDFILLFSQALLNGPQNLITRSYLNFFLNRQVYKEIVQLPCGGEGPKSTNHATSKLQ